MKNEKPKKPENPMAGWQPDRFPKPRTFPDGWDLSALSNANISSKSGESPEETTHVDEKRKEAIHESFPKPKTMPDGWDLSDLIKKI